MDITISTVSLPGEGLPMAAQFAGPKDGKPHPGILVVMEGGGVTEQVKDVGRRIAQEGYMTIVPDFFYRAANAELPADRRQRTNALMGQVWDIRVMADVRVALNHLKSQGATKLGCIGFCFGGRTTYLAAACHNDIAAAVPFYGASIAGGTPSLRFPVAPVEMTSGIKAAVLAFFGDRDQYIPMTAVQEVKAALAKEKGPHEVHVYAGASHGFFRDGSPDYHPQAAADAWERTKAWFRKYLA